MNLITKTTTKSLTGGERCNTDLLDKVMIHILGRTEQDSMRFHHATQNDTVENMSFLLLEFSINFFGPQLTAIISTMENKTAGKGDYCIKVRVKLRDYEVRL